MRPLAPEMHGSGIYRIDIGPNFYFGSAVKLSNRKWNHIKDLRSGEHRNDRMKKAFRKYGEFHFSILETVEKGDGFKDRILTAEQKYLDQFFDHPRCMNLAPIAGNCIGVKHTDESRKNMSEAHIGKQSGENHPLFGKTHSAEARKKISEAHKGRVWSLEAVEARIKGQSRPEVRAAMSKAKTGIKQSPETIEKRMINNRGAKNWKARGVWINHPSFGKMEFPTITNAAEYLGVPRFAVQSWVMGTSKWPGQGLKKNTKHSKYNGMQGGYI